MSARCRGCSAPGVKIGVLLDTPTGAAGADPAGGGALGGLLGNAIGGAGSVRYWHLADIDADPEHVRYWG